MFAELTLRLRDNGWGTLIPVANPGKRPLIAGWDAYNHAPPTDREIDGWCSAYPNAGIGLAYGPDGVLGVDLDFLEPAVAARAEAIVLDALGANECVRIGRLPKRLFLYRATAGLSVPGKAFGGYEIFSTTGQTVLYGTHPDTGRSYYWPAQSPEDISPSDLPVVGQDALDGMIEALGPLCSRVGRTRPAGMYFSGGGRVADWLRTFNTTDAKPVELCRGAVKAAPEGDRYGTVMSRAKAAAWLASVGIDGVTTKTFENSRARDPDPTGSVSILTPGDHDLIERLAPVLSREAIASLLTDEVAAALQPEQNPLPMTITLIPSPSSKAPENAAPAATAIAAV